MSTTRTVDPTLEPVTLEEIKSHLRIHDNTDSDVQLTGLIKQGREYVERVTGRALITQTWEMKLDGFYTGLKIPHPPLQSVTTVKYQDANNAEQTLAASNYTVDTDSEPARFVQSATGTFPSTYDDLNSVTITYLAGYGAARADVPEMFKHAIKLYVEKVYDMPVSSYADALDNALESLLINYKVDWLSL